MVVVVGTIVVLVVLVVDVDVDVDAVVGAAVGSAAAVFRDDCHWENTYETAPPPTSAVSTSNTMPTLRLERPARARLRL